ncbi:MAG: hypothetical protein ACYTAO_02640 [Planctomycetota bacterium]
MRSPCCLGVTGIHAAAVAPGVRQQGRAETGNHARAGDAEIVEPELLPGGGVVVGPPLELGHQRGIGPDFTDRLVDVDLDAAPGVVVDQGDRGGRHGEHARVGRSGAAELDPVAPTDVEQQAHRRTGRNAVVEAHPGPARQ